MYKRISLTLSEHFQNTLNLGGSGEASLALKDVTNIQLMAMGQEVKEPIFEQVQSDGKILPFEVVIKGLSVTGRRLTIEVRNIPDGKGSVLAVLRFYEDKFEEEEGPGHVCQLELKYSDGVRYDAHAHFYGRMARLVG